MMSTRRRRQDQAGFAMLVVFLLAAFVAISLYMELPRVVFESQRNREQTLIDRGEQYRRAIQLYYRRYQRYPPDMNALEDTDNRRFLRHRYKDPMTDKDEWRLIHAIAPGVFPDSLVYKMPAKSGQTESATTTASADTATPMWMQRRPSDVTLPSSQNPGAQGEMAMDTSSNPETTGAQLQPGDQANLPVDQQRPPGFPVPPGQMYPLGTVVNPGQQPGAPPGPGIQAPVIGGPVVPFGQSPVQPGQTPPVQAPPGLLAPSQIQPLTGSQTTPAGQGYSQAQAGAPQPAPIPGQVPSGSNPALDIIRTILTTPNPRGLSGVPSASTGQQPTTPLVAGVASNLEADSIKVYNERDKYNEWEFVYDPRQDRSLRVQAGAMPVGQSPAGSAGSGPAPGIPIPNPQAPPGRGAQNPFGFPGGGSQPQMPGR